MSMDIKYEDITFIEDHKIDVIYNTRKKFDSNAIEELASSIKQIGLINPLTVTFNESNGRYNLVAGERRLRACREVKMKQIPCIVVEGSTEALRELQLVENCQRKGITPIEELEAFAGLIASDYSPEDIALKIGKSIKYVLTRLNLMKLSDRAKMLLFNEELNLSQCRFLVAMATDVQDEALDELAYTDGMDNVKYKPADDFRKFFMSRQAVKLTKAIFDVKDENLYKTMGACTNCKHNSLHNKVLFADMSTDGFCAFRECFDRKTAIQVDTLKKRFKKEKLDVVEVAEHYDNDLPSAFEYTELTPAMIEEHGVKPELMLIITKGLNEVGKYYPVLTKKQKKLIDKATKVKAKDKKLEDKGYTEGYRKTMQALERYSELVVAKIAENLMTKDVMFTQGVHIAMMYKTYLSFDKEKRAAFLTMVTGRKAVSHADSAFFDYIKDIQNNLEYGFAILSLLDLKPEYVFKDDAGYLLILELASEANVNLAECKREIAEEMGVDLTKA